MAHWRRLTEEASRRAAIWRPGPDAVLCPLCGWSGPGFWADDRCPACRSLPRNRLFGHALDHVPVPVEGARVLHVAGNPAENAHVASRRPSVHLTLDLDPSTHPRVLADLAALPVRAGSFDLAVAWHVLEHVPDDRGAIAQVVDALRPGGCFVVSVPIWPRLNPTTEDHLEVPAERREEVLFDRDHVRLCGLDYGDRLVDAGLTVRDLSVAGAPAALVRRLGLSPHHVCWIATKTA